LKKGSATDVCSSSPPNTIISSTAMPGDHRLDQQARLAEKPLCEAFATFR
jgi:hypothetical protein